jgi:superfamily II RNA helicase
MPPAGGPLRAAAPFSGVTAGSGADAGFEALVAWVEAQGMQLYPAQEEALLEVFAGNHVVLNTPTGSGKSLVALGAHVAAVATGRRSFYTAPIKALVSEKFFDLCDRFGAERVGMLTGDATINPQAPVVCATAEIVANMALRLGADAPVDQVVMDEFHFYGDPERGWAWQVPLLELTRTQFLLMSATLGDTRRIEEGLLRRSGRQVAVVRSATRPVPLRYEYRRSPLHETIEALLAADQAPLYVVHFTQAAAVSQAQALTSADVTTRAQREAIAEAVAGFRFAPGFGATLSRLIRHGIGVHHGGMLPKYRRLVERFTQAGLLRVVVGTDTLGVGVNLPLRTVVLTGLAKYDGTTSRLLSAREFHQIAGRAGRAGFDTAGLVVVQAPEHVIDNERAVEKAAGDPRKLRRIVRSQPPRGFVPWDEAIFERIVASPPEPLTSQLRISHSLLLEVLDRPGDGCAALRHLLVDNDEPRAVQRRLVRRSIALYRSLLGAGALERLPAPDDKGRRVRVTGDLQMDFALDNPLSPWALEALPLLDRASPTFVLDVMSVVEATLDNPRVILAAQLDRLRTETLAELKAQGMEYEQRLEVLDRLEYPKPLRDWTYDLFNVYRARHPWAADYDIHPKSVARDLYERAMTFGEYVAHYGLARSEGLLLRYLTDVYKALVRTVPEDDKTDEVVDLSEWLGELVRQVDSSLIDEWRRLTEVAAAGPTGEPAAVARAEAVAPDGGAPPVTANRRAFRVMVRNAAFRRVELAARRDLTGLSAGEAPGGWAASEWSTALDAYHAERGAIGTGPDARATAWVQIDEGPRVWRVRQVLDDPEGWHDAAIIGEVDLADSDAAGEPVWRTLALETS